MEKSKLLLKILSVVLIILLVFYSVLIGLGRMMGFDYLEKEELTEILIDNFDLFNETATDIVPLFTENMEFTTISHGIWLFEMDEINLKHGLILRTNYETKREWTKEKTDVINNSKAYKILRKPEFEKIVFYLADNSVYFQNRSGIGFSNGLMYCESGQPQYEYISTCEHIVGNWYYCVTE